MSLEEKSENQTIQVIDPSTENKENSSIKSRMEEDLNRLILAIHEKNALEKLHKLESLKIQHANLEFRQKIESYYANKELVMPKHLKDKLNKLSPINDIDEDEDKKNAAEMLEKLNYLEEELKKMELLNAELGNENENLQNEYNLEMTELINLNEKLGSTLDNVMERLDKKSKILEKMEKIDNENDEEYLILKQEIEKENAALVQEYEKLSEDKVTLAKELQNIQNQEKKQD